MYDPINITIPYVAIDTYNPPVVPNYQCEPQLMQYRPLVAGMLMTELVQYAGRNPLRTYAYNMFARQAWSNEDFYGLFKKGMDYLAFVLFADRSAGFRSPEEAIGAIIPKLVSMAVADNVNYAPVLANYIDQETYVNVQEQTQFWQRLMSSIGAYCISFSQTGWPFMLLNFVPAAG